MIEVDHRERKYNDPNYSIPSLLQKLGVPFIKKHLLVGDYIIPGEEIVAGVELKNALDYIGSVLDGRLNDELLNLSANFDYPILLVYGSVSEALVDTQVKRETWFQYLAGCVLDISPVGKGGKVSVINVEDEFDAAYFLRTLDRKITSGKIYRSPTSTKVKIPKGKEKLYAVKWMFPPDCFIGDRRAELILKQYSTIRELVNTDIDTLKEIEGIGDKIAKRMYEHLNR